MALLYCVQNIRKPQNGRGSTQIGEVLNMYTTIIAIALSIIVMYVKSRKTES